MVSTEAKRSVIAFWQEEFGVSQRRACRAMNINRTSVRYRSVRPHKDETLMKEILDLSHRYPRFGYRRVATLLRLEGWQVNDKRVYRLWCEAGLKVKKKVKKRKALGQSKNGISQKKATKPNEVWTIDFLFDRTEKGKRLKIMPVLDEFTRECKAILVENSIKSKDVIQVLKGLFRRGEKPDYVRSDNGPEYIAKELRTFLKKEGSQTLFIEPGSPWENGFIESFNSRLRDEFLNMELFYSTLEAKVMTENHRRYYNNHRPHSSLGGLSPMKFAQKWSDENGLS